MTLVPLGRPPERPKWDSDRTIGLPPETSFVLEVLRAHRQRQRLERIACGTGWATTVPFKTARGITLVDNDLVFTTHDGRPIAGSYIDEGPFREMCRTAGIPYSTRERKGLRLHDLRHSAATILLAIAAQCREAARWASSTRTAADTPSSARMSPPISAARERIAPSVTAAWIARARPAASSRRYGIGRGPAPRRSMRAPQNGWSPWKGTTTVGAPARRPAAIVPAPP